MTLGEGVDMGITWTKKFAAADDGDPLTGAQLGTLQDDIGVALSGTSPELWKSMPVQLKTASYTLVADDVGKMTVFNSATGVVATLPDITASEVIAIRNINAGTVTITPDASDTCDVASIIDTETVVLVADSVNNKWRCVSRSSSTASAVATPVKLGSWETKADATTYQASTDGFVVGCCRYSAGGAGTQVELYTDSNSTPTTLRGFGHAINGSYQSATLMCPVKKNDYWRTVGCLSWVYWIPLS